MSAAFAAAAVAAAGPVAVAVPSGRPPATLRIRGLTAPRGLTSPFGRPAPAVSPAGPRTRIASSSNDRSGQTTEKLDGGLDPSLEQAVPRDQRPVNELKQLKDASLYSWALLDTPGYLLRLGALFGVTFFFLAAPISTQNFDPTAQPLEFFLSSSTGSLLVVLIAIIRIYLGWSYVGNRLLSASVAYEETGWYDGQIFVKPPEVLSRDRLLGTYEVKPTLAKLKTTLLGSALSLVGCAVALNILTSQADANEVYGQGSAQPRVATANGVLYSQKVSDVSQLMYDDEAAAAEAAAAGPRPAYCGDRYFKSLAGGEDVCAKFN